MIYFIYSKIQSRRDFFASTYQYILVDEKEVRFTEKNTTGISTYSDSILVYTSEDIEFTPIHTGYKKTKEV